MRRYIRKKKQKMGRRGYRPTISRVTGLLLCIIKNQAVMMVAMQKILEKSYLHTACFGSDYIDMLQHRIDASGKIIEL